MMNFINRLMDVTRLGVCVCVCVVRWPGVNRNWKWVFSYARQGLVPTHTEVWGH